MGRLSKIQVGLLMESKFFMRTRQHKSAAVTIAGFEADPCSFMTWSVKGGHKILKALLCYPAPNHYSARRGWFQGENARDDYKVVPILSFMRVKEALHIVLCKKRKQGSKLLEPIRTI